MHISIKKYLTSSVVVEKLLWPQNRVIFVVFALDRLYMSTLHIEGGHWHSLKGMT
jgi:hypothetical protein